MKQVEGYNDPKHPDWVLKLLKNLYGLKQAPRVWHKVIDPFIYQDLGYTPLTADPCFYIKWYDEPFSIIYLHVDDILISPCTGMNLAQVKQQFVTRFNKVTDDGEATEIVAIKLQWNIPQRSVTLSQEYRTREILDDYNMSTCNPISTPIETLTISNKDCPEVGSDEWHLMQQIPYRECVGRLTNLSRTTRPDISYAVLQSNRYLHNPGLKH
jgi:hypothetical protein